MPDVTTGSSTRSAIRTPIRWVGYSWDPERVVRFEDAGGQRFEVGARAALDTGIFEWSTTTPVRCGALRAWASDPSMAWAPVDEFDHASERRHP